MLEAQYQLEKEDGLKADFLRVRAIPFNEEVTRYIEKYEQVFIVEMNRDGQMHQILLTEYPQFAMRFKSIAYQDGLPASAKWVRAGILAHYTKTVGSEKKAVVGKKKAVKVKPKKTARVAKKAAGTKAPKKTAAGKTVKQTKRK